MAGYQRGGEGDDSTLVPTRPVCIGENRLELLGSAHRGSAYIHHGSLVFTGHALNTGKNDPLPSNSRYECGFYGV